MTIRGLLFDLDGTLVDTAPDLVAVLNTLLERSGLPPVPYAIARNEVSNGAIGLIRLGFGFGPEQAVDAALRSQFLELYREWNCVNSSLFIKLDSIYEIVSIFDGAWGIVTNKPEALTFPLLEQLGLAGEPGCVICGDTLPQRKPDPAPLLLAAEQLGHAPESCVYVGDARRDIDAGRAAGMRTVAATYGYIRPAEPVAQWRANAVFGHPNALAGILRGL